MTTVTQEIVYSEKKRFNDYNEQRNKTNKWKKMLSNTYVYKNEKSTKINENNGWSIELPHEQYYQHKLPSSKNYKIRYHTGSCQSNFYKNKPTNNENSLKSVQESDAYDFSKNKDHLQNSNVCNSENNTQTQQKKTPITLLNEWAMRHNKSVDNDSKKKKNVVSYELIALTGQAHRPVFTYMCRVLDKTAKGDGFSKKEAKQNSAAQLWKLFEINSNSVQHPTSTTNDDNFQVNKNHAENVTSVNTTLVMNNDESDSSVRSFINDTVKVAQCGMNPVGTLQELCTTQKWMPPFYNFQRSGKGRGALFEVTCQFFYLLTSGVANTKQCAKRKAARCMLNLVCDIDMETLNQVKQETNIIVPEENGDKNECIEKCILVQEINQELPQEWKSTKCFRLYLTQAISVAVNSLPEFSSYSLSADTSSDQYLQQRIEHDQLTKDLEQYIMKNDNSDSNAVDKLETLCQILNFQTIYLVMNDDEKTKLHTDGDKKYNIVIQVTTIPIVVSIGQDSSIDAATEKAAQNILNTFKTLLLI